LVEEILKKVLNYALKSGADEAEVYLRRYKEKFIKGEGEKLTPSSIIGNNLAIRVSVGKKIGLVSTSTLNLNKLYEEVDRAISIAKVSDEDKYWHGLPDPTKPIAKEVYSDELSSLEIADMMKDCRLLYKEAERESRDIKICELYNSVVTWEKWIINSRGIEAYDRGAGEHFVVMAKGKSAKREVSIYDGWSDTKVIRNKVDITIDVINRVKTLFEAEKLGKPMKASIIFSPLTLAEILQFVFTPAIRADNVEEGRSPLHDKLGKEVCSKELSITDDGTLADGLATSKYDDEGVAKRRTEVIKNGVLTSFLYNTYYARKVGKESTGNAFRARGIVGISYTNLVIHGNNKTLDNLISEIDEGIFVMGFPMNPHSSNYVTGEINAVLYEAYYIKSGSIEKPLYPLNVSGNIYEAFKEIRIAGKPIKTMFSIYLPYMILQSLTVA